MEAYRILQRGGVFLYPADRREGYEDGRLRLVYEANPIAFLIEGADGAATDGIDPILSLIPTRLHQRTPLIFGARNEVARLTRYRQIPPGVGERSPLFGHRGLFRV
jgi:fructose-1,6-bisphosphatase I